LQEEKSQAFLKKKRIHDDEIREENFIEAMLPYAEENEEKYKIFPSITIAQAIL
jgi:Muramidase (flagellum-specific)